MEGQLNLVDLVNSAKLQKDGFLYELHTVRERQRELQAQIDFLRNEEILLVAKANAMNGAIDAYMSIIAPARPEKPAAPAMDFDFINKNAVSKLAQLRSTVR